MSAVDSRDSYGTRIIESSKGRITVMALKGGLEVRVMEADKPALEKRIDRAGDHFRPIDTINALVAGVKP